MLIGLLVNTTLVLAQDAPAPLSEARKAIRALENEPARIDSLRRNFESKWLIELTFGNRFISRSNQTLPDTLTSTDVAQRKAFFGLGLGYFFTDRIRLSSGLEVSVLPKNQEIDIISLGGGAITGSGSGGGGIVMNLHIEGQYYFTTWRFTRPYLAAALGVSNVRVKGGEVSFSSLSGQSQNINSLRSRLATAQLHIGINHRPLPGLMLDWNIGYRHSSRGDAIGGITGTGGLITSVAMQFVLKPKER